MADAEPESWRIDLDDLAATVALGRAIGRLLFPNAVVALVGTLGAGKTHLVQAIAEGLDVVDPALVNSPTFVLIQEYAARLTIYHCDTYRLPDAEAYAQLGMDELYEAGGVCLVEWADRVEAYLPEAYLRIDIAIVDESARTATVTAIGDAEAGYAALADALRRTMSAP